MKDHVEMEPLMLLCWTRYGPLDTVKLILSNVSNFLTTFTKIRMNPIHKYRKQKKHGVRAGF